MVLSVTSVRKPRLGLCERQCRRHAHAADDNVELNDVRRWTGQHCPNMTKTCILVCGTCRSVLPPWGPFHGSGESFCRLALGFQGHPSTVQSYNQLHLLLSVEAQLLSCKDSAPAQSAGPRVCSSGVPWSAAGRCWSLQQIWPPPRGLKKCSYRLAKSPRTRTWSLQAAVRRRRPAAIGKHVWYSSSVLGVPLVLYASTPHVHLPVAWPGLLTPWDDNCCWLEDRTSGGELLQDR